MSPRKLTEDDKQEILNLYRNSEATTSTLANDYEVSSSTISRFLKNKLSSVEYEDLIQQKRLARTPRGEKAVEITTEPRKKVATTKKVKAKSSPKKASAKDKITKTKTAKTRYSSKKKQTEVADTKSSDTVPELPVQLELGTPLESKSEPKPTRRRRRRSSSAPEEIAAVEAPIEIPQLEETEKEAEATEATEEKSPNKLVIDRQPGGNAKPIGEEESDFSKASSLLLKADRVDLDEDDEENDDSEVDLVAIKEMLGDDLEDFNDEDDDEDDDWDDDGEEDVDFPPHSSNLHDLEILPLSEASMPRICYLVIDRSAELIVKPLADFADLGDIPQEEVRQRTLPIFDNHRIAKRFSHRRERVIKVPDGRMIQKTSHHLENKGITRLLIDGQIYSLAH